MNKLIESPTKNGSESSDSEFSGSLSSLDLQEEELTNLLNSPTCSEFTIGQPVWAKLHGFPWFPAEVFSSVLFVEIVSDCRSDETVHS